MNQILAWMDKKTTKTDNESKKYKSKRSKPGLYSSNNRILSNRVACRINRSKLSSKWTKTSKSKNLGNLGKLKGQKSLTPSVNKISKLASFNPFLSPDQHKSKSSGLRRYKTMKVNTFLQRMDKFGTSEAKNNYLSKKNKKNESEINKKESRRIGSKNRLLTKVKSHKSSMTPGSLKRMKKYISGSILSRGQKKYPKKKSGSRVKRKESSLMFSKFLRSMEMQESPVLKTEGNVKSREKVKRQVKWLLKPNVLGVLLNSGALLIQIFDCLESKKDIYDHVKDYVEISQNPLFNKFEEEVTKGIDAEIGKNFCFNMKLERWVILFFFYFSFNGKEGEKVKSVLSFLAKKICENFYSVIVSVRATGLQGFDLEEVKKEVNQLMRRGGFDTKYIERNAEKIASRNLTEIKNLLKICASHCVHSTKEKLEVCIENCSLKKICSITEECLETFYPFLAEKRVISVEIIESGKKKKQKKSSKKKSEKLSKEITPRKKKKDDPGSVKKFTSSSTKIDSSGSKKLLEKRLSKNGNKEFQEFIRQLENQESKVEDQLFFFQPELENEDETRPEPPFLPKKKSKHEFTLVLDLDETLVHFEETDDSQQFLVRPYAQQFLTEMGKYFEVVIFTAAVQEYADWILERIDDKKVISYRLYRQHTRPEHNVFIKDLSLIGREVNKSIIVDNNAENFQKQPENGIFIKSWYGDQNDLALFKLTPILKQISLGGCDDVRIALRKLKEAMVKGIKRGSTKDWGKNDDKENVPTN